MDLGNITLILVLRFCIFWTYSLPIMLHVLDTRRYGIYCKNKKNLHCCGEQRLSKPSGKSKIKKWGKPANANFWIRNEHKICVLMFGFLSIYLIWCIWPWIPTFLNFSILPFCLSNTKLKKNWGLCPKSKGGGSLILDIVLFFTASFLCFIMFDWRL